VNPSTLTPKAPRAHVAVRAGRLWNTGRLQGFVESLTDEQLAFGIGLALLALSAWPLLLVDVPPVQDLPNHLATMPWALPFGTSSSHMGRSG
jgi:hypothetical protein